MDSFRRFLKPAALILCLTFCVSASGCARLKPNEYAEYGYKGEATVKEGKRILILDWLGNIVGAFSKLILWNWKVERHWVREESQQAIQDYIAKNKDTLGDVQVQLNRYAPQDAWPRLIHNKGVKWPYRVFIGSFVVLFIDTLFVDRIFGADYYNPYTHTVYLFSDIPSVALHELGHAKDFGERRYRGSYGLFRIIPFANLYQEWIATDKAFSYIREEKQVDREIEAYKILYPAYGTYVGGYFVPYGSIAGAIVGHIWGRAEAHDLEQRVHATA
ncbi:MAG TPA: hypothetical protein VL688_09585 [Verrucomicrobiae bacterium]|nr:hypothetical protein [Verrucomicrobiae bacterium]